MEKCLEFSPSFIKGQIVMVLRYFIFIFMMLSPQTSTTYKRGDHINFLMTLLFIAVFCFIYICFLRLGLEIFK